MRTPGPLAGWRGQFRCKREFRPNDFLGASLDAWPPMFQLVTTPVRVQLYNA